MKININHCLFVLGFFGSWSETVNWPLCVFVCLCVHIRSQAWCLWSDIPLLCLWELIHWTTLGTTATSSSLCLEAASSPMSRSSVQTSSVTVGQRFTPNNSHCYFLSVIFLCTHQTVHMLMDDMLSCSSTGCIAEIPGATQFFGERVEVEGPLQNPQEVKRTSQVLILNFKVLQILTSV